MDVVAVEWSTEGVTSSRKGSDERAETGFPASPSRRGQREPRHGQRDGWLLVLLEALRRPRCGLAAHRLSSEP